MKTIKKLDEKILEKEYEIPYNDSTIPFQVICHFWTEYNPIDHEYGREDYYSIEHENMVWLDFPEYTEDECCVIEQYFTENYYKIFLTLYNDYRKLNF